MAQTTIRAKSALTISAFGCLMAIGFTAAAAAQNFPDRPMTLIVAFAAGGAADTTDRIMADAMSKILEQ